jgi:hypothetical protein
MRASDHERKREKVHIKRHRARQKEPGAQMGRRRASCPANWEEQKQNEEKMRASTSPLSKSLA